VRFPAAVLERKRGRGEISSTSLKQQRSIRAAAWIAWRRRSQAQRDFPGANVPHSRVWPEAPEFRYTKPSPLTISNPILAFPVRCGRARRLPVQIARHLYDTFELRSAQSLGQLPSAGQDLPFPPRSGSQRIRRTVCAPRFEGENVNLTEDFVARRVIPTNPEVTRSGNPHRNPGRHKGLRRPRRLRYRATQRAGILPLWMPC